MGRLYASPTGRGGSQVSFRDLKHNSTRKINAIRKAKRGVRENKPKRVEGEEGKDVEGNMMVSKLGERGKRKEAVRHSEIRPNS
jgi:hypothetical protein